MQDQQKKPSQQESHLCNIKGAILGYPGEPWNLLADGTGSTFPLFFISAGKKEALWTLECTWENCMEDKFDAETVRLNINLDHPDCPDDIRQANQPSQDFDKDRTETPTDPGIAGPFTKSIVRTGIATLILQIQQTEPENWQLIKEATNLKSAQYKRGSVAHAARCFYDKMKLSDQDPATLMQTAEKYQIKF